MGGYDGHRGWIYSVAVDEKERHREIGTALLKEVEQKLRRLGCLKVNLQVMPDNKGVRGVLPGAWVLGRGPDQHGQAAVLRR